MTGAGSGCVSDCQVSWLTSCGGVPRGLGIVLASPCLPVCLSVCLSVVSVWLCVCVSD